MVRVVIEEKCELNIGERYVINKPDDIHVFPHWNESFMDVLDGLVCKIDTVTRIGGEGTVDVDFPKTTNRKMCYISSKWLTKVGDEPELQERNFDIKELF